MIFGLHAIWKNFLPFVENVDQSADHADPIIMSLSFANSEVPMLIGIEGVIQQM
ncbi:hypothetical protein [Marinifilum sp. D714]|uniref:hypothetical protein n=1 Tax=Marinifilum sp. D714 TaxID=2937523 RepID=UPI0027BE20AC|nr:hypothetical protein [Marinifilum sp. D714]MDQ2180240.1 hypothetical protein [Marinifilum sp. D714]